MRFGRCIQQIILALILVLVTSNLTLVAQEESRTKVTIIKETYDEHGNKTVQKITKEGAEADAIDIEKLAEGTYQQRFDFKGFENFDDPSLFGGQSFEELRSLFDSLNLGNLQFFGGDADDFGSWNPFGQLEDDYAVKPKLGVKINELESESGVLVTHVIEGTPAHRAGIKEGDIILAVNEEQVTSSKFLVDYIQRLKADDTLIIDVRRDDEHLQIEATLTEYKPKKDLEIRKI